MRAADTTRRRDGWRGFLTGLFLALALAGGGTGAARAGGAVQIKPPVDTGFYALRSIDPEEAKEIARQFLSPDGKVGYVASRNLLVITDYPDRVESVKKVLKEMDSDPVNIRVEVSFLSAGETRDTGIGVEHGGIRITRETGGHTRVTGRGSLTLRDHRDTTSGESTQSVLAGNNRPARIWVGRTVPDPVWIFNYGCNQGWWQRDVVWQDLGASLWVRPRLLPDGRIEVQVYPKVTFRGDRDIGVEVREVASTVVVADGQSMPLGGLDESRREVYTRLLGRDSVFNGNSLDISVRASVLPMGPPPAPVPRTPARAPEP